MRDQRKPSIKSYRFPNVVKARKLLLLIASGDLLRPGLRLFIRLLSYSGLRASLALLLFLACTLSCDFGGVACLHLPFTNTWNQTGKEKHNGSLDSTEIAPDLLNKAVATTKTSVVVIIRGRSRLARSTHMREFLEMTLDRSNDQVVQALRIVSFHKDGKQRGQDNEDKACPRSGSAEQVAQEPKAT